MLELRCGPGRFPPSCKYHGRFISLLCELALTQVLQHFVEPWPDCQPSFITVTELLSITAEAVRLMLVYWHL